MVLQRSFIVWILAIVTCLSASGDESHDTNVSPKPQIADAEIIDTILTSTDMDAQRQAFDRICDNPEKFGPGLLRALQREIERNRKTHDVQRVNRLLCLAAATKYRDIGVFLLGVLTAGDCETEYSCTYSCPFVFSLAIYARFVDSSLSSFVNSSESRCADDIRFTLQTINSGGMGGRIGSYATRACHRRSGRSNEHHDGEGIDQRGEIVEPRLLCSRGSSELANSKDIEQ